MTVIMRYLELPPVRLWRLIIDSRTWQIRSHDFAPELGNRFRIVHLPLVGTTYSGAHVGEVTQVAAGQSMTLAIETMTRKGPTTCWNIFLQLDESLSGTQITVTISGLNNADRRQRMLLYVATRILEVSLPKPALIHGQNHDTQLPSRRSHHWVNA